jgi:hypothetical protein
MLSGRTAFENDACPVNDDLLGAMYRASPEGLAMLMDSVPGDIRAMLALFCYRRHHLHGLGLAIAASCGERDLLEQGGRVGVALHALSREAKPSDRPAEPGNRRGITLSTAPLRPLPPMDDDIDDDESASGAGPSSLA